MADASGTGSSVSLADVLWELGPAAARMLYTGHYLGYRPGYSQGGDVAPIRLACRALRDAVDGNMEFLRFKLSPAGAQYWRPGLLHARWPLCSYVEVIVVGEEDGPRDPGAAALLALPFEGLDQSAAGATRITDVCLTTTGAVLTCAEPAITLVVQRLPWLQQLDASGLHAEDLLYEPDQLGRMWQALAALRELSFLQLPSVRTLAGAKCPLSYGGGCFMVAHIPNGLTDSMCAQAAAGLSRLQTVTTLWLENDAAGGAAAFLSHALDDLPASLQELVIRRVSGRQDATELEVQFKDGFITRVEPGYKTDDNRQYHSLTMIELAELAQLLLRSRALGPRLEWLGVDTVHVASAAPLGGEALASLRALVDRADKVFFHQVLANRDCLQSLAQAIELLGKPSFLVLPDQLLRLDGGPGHGSGAVGAGSSRGTAAGPGGELLPSVPSLLRAAARRMTDEARAAAAAAAAAPAGAPDASHRMLLLTGPAVADLRCNALWQAWVRSINGGKRRGDVLAYSLISEADALLMEFSWHVPAAAMAAAASGVLADDVQAVAWSAPKEAASRVNIVAAWIRKAVCMELEEVWAPRFASAARHEHLDLLRCLWRVRERLEEIVP